MPFSCCSPGGHVFFSFTPSHPTQPHLDHQCLSDNLLENLEASIQNCSAKVFFQPSDQKASCTQLPVLKGGAQKNHCPRSSSTKEKSPSFAPLQSRVNADTLSPLPTTPRRSVPPAVCISLSISEHWCRTVLRVAITLYRVPIC